MRHLYMYFHKRINLIKQSCTIDIVVSVLYQQSRYVIVSVCVVGTRIKVGNKNEYIYCMVYLKHVF